MKQNHQATKPEYWQRVWITVKRQTTLDLDAERDMLLALYGYEQRTDWVYAKHCVGIGDDHDLDLLIQRQIRRQGGRVCEERYKDNDDVV